MSATVCCFPPRSLLRLPLLGGMFRLRVSAIGPSSLNRSETRHATILQGTLAITATCAHSIGAQAPKRLICKRHVGCPLAMFPSKTRQW